MSFFYNIPIFGSYSVILAISVVLIAVKLFLLQSDKKEHTQHTVSEKIETKNLPENKTTNVKVKKCGGNKSLCTKKIKLKNKVLHIYYTSKSEETRKLVDILQSNSEENDFKCDILDLSIEFEIEEKLPEHNDGATIFILDKEDSITWFTDWLHSSSINPKLEKNFLKDIKFAVYDCSANDDSVAVKWDKYLWKLGGRRLKKVNTKKNNEKTIIESFKEWEEELMVIVQGTPKKKVCACGPKKKKTENDCDSHSSSSCDSSSDNADGGSSLVDVEDLLLLS